MGELIVAKFGGSSLADSRQIEKVGKIIRSNEKIRYIIPSAPGKRNKDDHKITDLLCMCYQLSSHGLNFHEIYSVVEDRFKGIVKGLNLDLDIVDILDEISKNIKNGASKDYCASRGEYLNGIVLSNYLDIPFIDAKDLILFDQDGIFKESESLGKIRKTLKDIDACVIPGFYGADEEGKIRTFSRGGSDITGAIIASGVAASLYENWTDVSGFLMADPSIVGDAKPIERITYKELRELSYMGAPVLHEDAIFPVKKENIPVNIKNTNKPGDPGTMIVYDTEVEDSVGEITGIAGKKDFTVISIEKTFMNSEKDFFRKIISVFETNNVGIEHMPSGIDSISIIVSDLELNGKKKKIIEEIKIYCSPDNIVCYSGMALVAVVGRGMINKKGISSKVFTALAKADINIRMISQGSSELNIIVGVENKDFDKAVLSIYKAFE